MAQPENIFISELDLVRSKILKITYPLSFFKKLILSRSERILTLAVLALSFYFVICLFFPLWVLMIGPIIWGIPHLISSLRYNTLLGLKPDHKKTFILFQTFVWLSVFIYRVSIDVFQANPFLAQTPLLFEGLCLVFSFLFQIYLSQKYNEKTFVYSLFFAALIYCTHYFPIQTALGLLIGHNYIPLIVWFKSCQNTKDKAVFYFVSFLFIGLSLLIFFGAFDFIYKHFEPQSYLPFLKWDYNEVINSYKLTDTGDSLFWFHIVSLYAFSQSIHYFLWMKAIPENFQNQQYPPSFHTSLKQLSSDFGSGSVLLLVSLVFCGMAYWLFFEFQLARTIYFAVASYHGFMELSALPFLKSNQKTSSVQI